MDSKVNRKDIARLGKMFGALCVMSLSACADGTVTQDQYPDARNGGYRDAAHGYMKAKSPLLNPDGLTIRIRPLHAGDSDYVEVVSQQVFVTDGWYLIEFRCPEGAQLKARSSAPKTEHKPIHLNSGELGYKLTCKFNDLDIETLIPGGPFEIVG